MSPVYPNPEGGDGLGSWDIYSPPFQRVLIPSRRYLSTLQKSETALYQSRHQAKFFLKEVIIKLYIVIELYQNYDATTITITRISKCGKSPGDLLKCFCMLNL